MRYDTGYKLKCHIERILLIGKTGIKAYPHSGGPQGS